MFGVNPEGEGKPADIAPAILKLSGWKTEGDGARKALAGVTPARNHTFCIIHFV